MKTRRCNNGLSLIEMLIAVAVIALLATMAIGIASRIESQTKEKALKGVFASLEGALQEYRDFTGDFPIGGLYDELRSVPASREILDRMEGSVMGDKLTVGQGRPARAIYDPWGMPLIYEYRPGDTFPKLTSAGPDKEFRTADDISNR
jgi:prepilin-type N-terminal cleavage/methylation domain-containing protein